MAITNTILVLYSDNKFKQIDTNIFSGLGNDDKALVLGHVVMDGHIDEAQVLIAKISACAIKTLGHEFPLFEQNKDTLLSKVMPVELGTILAEHIESGNACVNPWVELFSKWCDCILNDLA